MTTYTSYHRESYMRHQERNKDRMRAYYVSNQDDIKRKRRERYAEQRRTRTQSAESESVEA
jgi:hypothetical protein